VLASTPESEVAAKIRLARDLTPDTTIQNAVAILGNGSQVTAPDTVPFVLWSAVHHLDNYEEALWATVSGLGDMDTTCAMVGGIVVMYTGLGGIPIRWRQNREVLPGA
jgi:ADP-ribosylglycohydrolase